MLVLWLALLFLKCLVEIYSLWTCDCSGIPAHPLERWFWISGVPWLRMRDMLAQWMKWRGSSGWAASSSSWGLQLHPCSLLNLGASSKVAYCWHSQNHLGDYLESPSRCLSPLLWNSPHLCGRAFTLWLLWDTFFNNPLQSALVFGGSSKFHSHWWFSSLFSSSYAKGVQKDPTWKMV